MKWENCIFKPSLSKILNFNWILKWFESKVIELMWNWWAIGKVKSPYGNKILINGIITFSVYFSVRTNMKFNENIPECLLFFGINQEKQETERDTEKSRNKVKSIKLQIYVNNTFVRLQNCLISQQKRQTENEIYGLKAIANTKLDLNYRKGVGCVCKFELISSFPFQVIMFTFSLDYKLSYTS